MSAPVAAHVDVPPALSAAAVAIRAAQECGGSGGRVADPSDILFAAIVGGKPSRIRFFDANGEAAGVVEATVDAEGTVALSPGTDAIVARGPVWHAVFPRTTSRRS